mgnify:CR=1 FL=1
MEVLSHFVKHKRTFRVLLIIFGQQEIGVWISSLFIVHLIKNLEILIFARFESNGFQEQFFSFFDISVI